MTAYIPEYVDLEQTSPVYFDIALRANAEFTCRVDSVTPAVLFSYHANRLLQDTENMSSIDDMRRNSSFVSLIGLGDAILPLILDRLDRSSEIQVWLSLLPDLAHADPVDEAHMGLAEDMARDWINWGIRKGIIHG